MIGGKDVPAGTYGLITIPNIKTWTIIITKNAEQWGTYGYKMEEDLVRFDAKVEALTKKAENFTMGLTDLKDESANIYIKWDMVSVKFPIKHDAHSIVMKEIDQKMQGSEITTDSYFSAADYYYDKGIELEKALQWANKVVEADQKYWTYYLRGKIAAKLGKCDIALEDARKGIEMAKAENDPAYVNNHQKVINSCTKK
jgi:tetratricopeptide (TPR) repeat protein